MSDGERIIEGMMRLMSERGPDEVPLGAPELDQALAWVKDHTMRLLESTLNARCAQELGDREAVNAWVAAGMDQVSEYSSEEMKLVLSSVMFMTASLYKHYFVGDGSFLDLSNFFQEHADACPDPFHDHKPEETS